jgi:Asp-tRNA(Asn)/Glu-tRNA(Gln) amidotransferase A subunit family amidase
VKAPRSLLLDTKRLKQNGALPLGLQVVGAFMADEQLLSWAGLMAEELTSVAASKM